MTTTSVFPPPREGGVRTIENLRGPAGRLEALLNPGRISDPPSAAVLLCHPHPLFGGSMHNKVVYHAMKACTDVGLPVLRFNFRGVNRSEGAHDHGRGEQDDVRAGIEWLVSEYRLPILSMGFSFGANMALRVGARDPRVVGLVSLGTPIQAADRTYSYEFLHACTLPKLFLSGTVDDFGPVASVEAALSPVPEPKQIVWIADADHFFVGRLALMQEALREWLQAQFLSSQRPQERSDEAQP